MDPHITQARSDRIVTTILPDPNLRLPVKDVLKRLRHRVLLKPQRLWVKAQANDVVHQLTNAISEGDVSGQALSKRCRAVKTLVNPVDESNSELYSTPQGMQEVVSKLSSPKGD